MIQLIYTTKRGAGIIRALPDDEMLVRAAVERLHRRHIEVKIRQNGVEIGGVEELDGRWVYCYDFNSPPTTSRM